MEASSHDFVLTGGDRSAVDVVQEALAPRFPVVPAGRPRTVRHTCLDTFDWRLHGAGLTLEHAAGSGFSEYTLTDADGERITAGTSRYRWPALASALPPGPLRARLEPVSWVRTRRRGARATAAGAIPPAGAPGAVMVPSLRGRPRGGGRFRDTVPGTRWRESAAGAATPQTAARIPKAWATPPASSAPAPACPSPRHPGTMPAVI